jgi:hypothetical protein
VNYATRAGFLFANGGNYRLSTQYPTPFPPLLWVSASPDAPAASLSEVPWTTNHLGTVVSAMPTNYAVGIPFTVTISVNASDAVRAYAIEEMPPLGFAVTNVSHEGIFCPVTRKIRWGVFLGNTARTFSYQMIAATNSPAVAEFHGVASSNGVNQPVTGQRVVRRATTISPARLDTIKTLADGNRLLTFLGNPGVSYSLEGSSDLIEWTPLAELLNNDGALQFIDLDTNTVNKFYRATPRE